MEEVQKVLITASKNGVINTVLHLLQQGVDLNVADEVYNIEPPINFITLTEYFSCTNFEIRVI